MGRHRLPEDKKKVYLHLSITKEIVDQMKGKDINLSQLVEEYFVEYLKEKSPVTK